MNSNEPNSFLKELAGGLSLVLERLDQWLNRKQIWPYPEQTLHQLRQLSQHLRREIPKLATSPVYGIIVLMGGTGVGKSSLLNALAGEKIAFVSAVRPTTRHVMSYVHADIPATALPPSILETVVVHRNDGLRYKILVDAPDIDSRETDNYRRLREILPDADIILYVGSPEKYHDQIGWELFREYSRYKAFAFVLNRWDECADREKTGKSPDLDWLEDLAREGYRKPLLFRTSAWVWMEKRGEDKPPGEQFEELRKWLEVELGAKELVTIHHRNLDGLITDLVTVGATLADSVTVSRDDIWSAWSAILEGEIELFLIRSERFLTEQSERLEKFLRLESNRRIPGWLARTIEILRGWWSWIARPMHQDKDLYLSTYLMDLISDLIQALGNSYMRHYGMDLTNRLLVSATALGMPAIALEVPLQKIASKDWLLFWKEQVQSGLKEAMESSWQATGWKGRLRAYAELLPGRLCWLAGLAGISVLTYRMFDATMPYSPSLGDVLYFFLPFLLAEILSYSLVYYLSPRDWRALASIVGQRVRQRAREHFTRLYREVLDQLFSQLWEELRCLREILESARCWLQQIQKRHEELEAVRRLYREQIN
ncbi:MAG: GTPase [Gemmatales bacterium]|nr:50S ribosome-binding GTPase [Gemmatales bacterium]MDW7994732.1 GTPase [Gemmatales bacterium]